MKYATKLTTVIVLVFSLFLMTSCIEKHIDYEGSASFFIENKTKRNITVCFALNSNSLEETFSVNITEGNIEKIWEGSCVGCNPTPEMILKSLFVYDENSQLIYGQALIQNDEWRVKKQNANNLDYYYSEYSLIINSL